MIVKLFIAAGILGLTAVLLLSANSNLITENNDIVVKKQILAGATFSAMASEAGVPTTTVMAILEKTKGVYNLAQIAAGKDIEFIYDKTTGALKELVYEIDSEEKLTVKNISTTTNEQWEAIKAPIEYTIEIGSAAGAIENSLYQTIVSQGLDERVALALAEMFAWQVDFAAIQKGDSFKIIYEKKYREEKYDRPGNILAAEFINEGEKSQGFYFLAGGEGGYYDENGNSLQKILLKAPLQYKYISSGFTYRRWHPVLGGYSPHRAIDYAAPEGTPAVSVGDGTVTQAGWNSHPHYGISVTIRHNEMYTTVYGHFSSLVKGIKVGAKVKQGQVIGYVGSTGMSTGPHLHYELHKFGTFVNPFTEKIPAGEPIMNADRQAFGEIKNKYQIELDKIAI
jgi:murein DD-endopeptidase MepM/ murein hydrolase activator NlpD